MKKKKLLQLRIFEMQVKLRAIAEELLAKEKDFFKQAGMEKEYNYLYQAARYKPIKPIEDVLEMILVKTK